MNIPIESKIDLIKGSWFIFNERGHQIALYGSFSGKEVLYFDGKVVSETHNIKQTSIHTHTHDGLNYEISVNIPKVFGEVLVCTLTINGNVVKRYRTYYDKPKRSRTWIFIVIGVIYGFVNYYMNWSLLVFLITTFLLIYMNFLFLKGKMRIKVEEVT